MFHELLSRDRKDGRATGHTQGVGPETYLNGTPQGTTPEDARKDGHIIRARYAPLSPASGSLVSRSQQAIHETSGLPPHRLTGADSISSLWLSQWGSCTRPSILVIHYLQGLFPALLAWLTIDARFKTRQE